jgi:hypothetical protein
MAETLDRTDLAPAWVDAEIRPCGSCAFCGWRDARHRVLDAIVSRLSAGESVRNVADDYGYPMRFVGRIARELTDCHPELRAPRAELELLPAAVREMFAAAGECERALFACGPAFSQGYPAAAERSREAREALRVMVEEASDG